MINFPTSGIHVISNVDPLMDPSYQLFNNEELIDWKPKEDFFEDQEEFMRPGPRYDEGMVSLISELIFYYVYFICFITAL
jgi:hypothetical protein